MTIWLKNLLKIVFPSRCLFCSTFTQDLLLCTSCWNKLEFITEPKCKICGFPFQFDVGSSNLCALCLHEKPCFDSADSFLKYNFQSKIIVHKLKYGDQLHLASFFAKLIVDRIQDKITKCHVVYHSQCTGSAFLARKYNQAALLACNISKLTGVPFLANALLKKRHDIPQETHLNRDDRLKNVRGSFVAAPGAIQQLQGKDLILVDDVYTTGTTLNECSKVLKKAGCASVHAVTLAKVVI